MRTTPNMIRLTLVALLAVLAGGACASHSHKSVRTYDYSDEDKDAQRKHDDRAAKDELTSEYQMVSPGEMVVEPR